jgi:Zn-finger nucleic acid-binding protein
MECPKCHGNIAPIATHEGVELDFCSGCSGILFDAGELAEYFELATDIPELPTNLDNATDTDFKCPKCSNMWIEIRFQSTETLLIDLCRHCGVLWLDKGEFPRLEALAARIGTPKSKLLAAAKNVEKRGYQVIGYDKK